MLHSIVRLQIVLRCFIAGILLLGTSSLKLTAAESGKPGNSPQEAKPAEALEVRIPIDSKGETTFGAAACPVIVTGSQVWDLRRGEIQAELEGTVEQNVITVLSDDGKYFAAAMKSKNQENTPVCVWSTETGKKVCEIPGTPKRFADLIVFSKNKLLILGGRSTPDFQVWNIEDGKQAKPIDVKAKRVEQGKAAFSPDGEQFLSVVDDKLTLFKTATGKALTVMSPPRRMERLNGPAVAVPQPVRPVRGKPPAAGGGGDPREAVFVYAWLQALKFSPDGTEIAAVSTHPQPRLIVWDIKGKILFDEPLSLPSMAFWEHSLQWLPNKSGWLVSGHIIDRTLKRAVVGVRKKFGEDLRVWLYDDNNLVGAFPNNSSQLEAYAIPWKEIRESISTLNDTKETLLGPGKPVSIKIDFAGQVGGDAAQTANEIAGALGQRLQRDGIKVADGQETVFHLKFSEQAGDTLPIYERQSPFDFRGNDTGRKATERKGSLVVELTAKGEEASLWREALDATSARSFKEDINDVNIRKTMLESLTRQIRELYLPYYIPKDEQRLALPVVFQ